MGSPRQVAASDAGIHPSTFHDWMGRGREEPGPFREFADAVRKAEDDFHSRAARVIRDLLDPGYEPSVRLNAAKFALSHRFPGDWSSRQEVRTTGADGGPVQVAVTSQVNPLADRLAAMTPEQVDALLAKLS